MPKLTVVERNGKLVVVSETEANGGPKDTYIAVRPNKLFVVEESEEKAQEFIKDGGDLYHIVHYLRKDSDGNVEWLPKSYPRK